MSSPPWRIDNDGAPVVSLPCKHDVLIKPEWVGPDGRFLGRLSCTTDGCRRTLDAVVLEGWKGRP